LGVRVKAMQALKAFRSSYLGSLLRRSSPGRITASVLKRHGDGAGWVRATAASLGVGTPVHRLADLPAEQALELAYDVVLHRRPEPGDVEHYLPLIRSGTLSPYGLVEMLTFSTEWRFDVPVSKLAPSLHMSRCEFIQSLPPARRILDLGGTALGLSEGALVTMGYPYAFDELVIVDLPPSERHEAYMDSKAEHAAVESPLGPVSYRYHSMTDLSGFSDASFDLVYSGESIEHVPVAAATTVLEQVHRVLAPGAHLALDTPNGRVTRRYDPEFIDPDHDYEYSHEEMTAKLEAAGFEIVEMKGLNYAGAADGDVARSLDEVARRRGMFAKIEDCYLLAYLCKKRCAI